jgi:hypothetical protein
VEVEGGGLGKLPGVEEKLRWGLVGVGCSGAAGPRWRKELYAAEQAGGGARASVVAVGFRVRAQGARGGLKGGSWGSRCGRTV